MNTDSTRKLAALSIFLRIYGVLTLIIFSLLFVGFIVQSPLLAEHGGALNWTIWNDVRFGSEHAHVPPMLLLVYVVWGVFLLRAARNPPAYSSFLDFTMWANPAHAHHGDAGLTDVDRYWSKFLTGTLTRGMTVADWNGHWGREPNALIGVEVDPAAFFDRFIARVGPFAQRLG
jgi:hypothetical protein